MLLPLTTAQIFINTEANLLRNMIRWDFGSYHCTGYTCCTEDVAQFFCNPKLYLGQQHGKGAREFRENLCFLEDDHH